MTFKEFQDYYANKFQRNNPLPWQDGMQAIIWWITQSVPKNTRVTLAYGNESKVEISGDGTDASPYIWAFTLDMQGFVGPQGPAGPQGGLIKHNIELTSISGPDGQIKLKFMLLSEKTTILNFNDIVNLTQYAVPAYYLLDSDTIKEGVIALTGNTSQQIIEACGVVASANSSPEYVSFNIDESYDMTDFRT